MTSPSFSILSQKPKLSPFKKKSKQNNHCNTSVPSLLISRIKTGQLPPVLQRATGVPPIKPASGPTLYSKRNPSQPRHNNLHFTALTHRFPFAVTTSSELEPDVTAPLGRTETSLKCCQNFRHYSRFSPTRTCPRWCQPHWI